jgi:transposase-like protein
VKTEKDWDSLVERSVKEGIAYLQDEQTKTRVTQLLEESLTEMLAVERGEMKPTRRTVLKALNSKF